MLYIYMQVPILLSKHCVCVRYAYVHVFINIVTLHYLHTYIHAYNTIFGRCFSKLYAYTYFVKWDEIIVGMVSFMIFTCACTIA